MAISFDTLNSTKTYTFMGPSSGGASNIFTYTVEVTLNSSNSTQDYFSFDVTLKIRCNQSSFTWMNWTSQRVKLYMNAGSGASTNSEYLIHDVGLPDYSTGSPTVTIFTKENILISKPTGTTLYITIKVENTTGTSITYLPGSVTNNNTISVNITSGLDTMKLYPESAIQNIASAIRSANGLSSTYKVNQMGAAIGALTTTTLYESEVKSIVEGTITSISNSTATFLPSYIFAGCTSLSEAIFPAVISVGSFAFNSCNSLTSISFPACQDINQYGFAFCNTLQVASFPSCTSIGAYGFYDCYSLNSISFPLCISIGGNAFYGCSRLTSANFPSCTYINYRAFDQCSRLTTAIFPNCLFIGQSAFRSCSKLVTINFPKCTSIGSTAFQSCFSLAEITFSSVSTIFSTAFSQCSFLSFVDFPNCLSIESTAFYSCSRLTSVSFPKVRTLGYRAFYGCSSLSAISLPSIGTINGSVFQGCWRLLSLYIGTENCALVNAFAFSSTPIGGYTNYTDGEYGSIYVPSSLLASYQSATNWAAYSNRMVGV